jgi:hypothetical protein
MPSRSRASHSVPYCAASTASDELAQTVAMDPGARGELVLTEMGEHAAGTNHRARDFRYQHAEKSWLGDVETQGDVFHHRLRRWVRMQRPRGGILPVGQRVARSLPERWPALSLVGRFMDCAAQGHQLAHREGAA